MGTDRITFTISREILNDTLRRGILHVQRLTGMSYEAVGLSVGYRSASTLQQVMAREDVLPGPLPFVGLSRLFSRWDFDELSDACSWEDKRTLPIPAGCMLSLNGRIDDESFEIARYHGLGLDAWGEGELERAETALKRLIGQAFQALEEVRRRREGAVFPVASGDGLPLSIQTRISL